MASFRSGFKIIREITKKEGRDLLQRSFSAERSAVLQWESSSHGAQPGSTIAEGVEANRPARSTSWLSLWGRDEGRSTQEERETAVADEAPIVDTSLVCTVPVAQVGAGLDVSDVVSGPIQRMFEMQENHLHPKHAKQSNVSTGENSKKLPGVEFKAIDSKDFSHEPCEFPLTPRQMDFIKKLQHTSVSPMDDLKTVEPPKQMYNRYKKVDLDERADFTAKPLLHPVGVYNSLKKIFNSDSICLTDASMNLSTNARRFYSKSVMDPPYGNNASMECKKKTASKEKAKPACVKVPSGIEGGATKSSGECQKHKMPGCRVPVSTDCKPRPVKRAPCVKLEAPLPSYSECVKDPTPPARPTECPRDDSGPSAECLLDKTGFSYDGCNPPKPEIPVCIPKERNTAPKRKSKACTDNPTECDPSVKPYKEAGAGLPRQPLKFPGPIAVATVTEPMNMHQSTFPIRNFSSQIDPPYGNNASMECKKKSASKEKAKPACTKVPSGIEGGATKSSGECQKHKMPGCRVPVSTDCKPRPVKRAPCVKLEAPLPSYSECVKDPTPPARPTECPREHSGPSAECLLDKTGFSYDGCNPPKPEIPICIPKEKATAPKRKSKACTDNPTECDPSVKPYKEAGAGLPRQPKKCPSASTLTGVSEPTIVMKQFLPTQRSYSCSTLDPPAQNRRVLECSPKKANCGKDAEEAEHKPCFVTETLKKKKNKQRVVNEDSPVSCTMKHDQKSKCDEATAERPWRLCEKPANIFADKHVCPKPEKKAEVKIVKVAKIAPCDTPTATFKVCAKPPPRKLNYRCPELGAVKVKATTLPPPPPTPKRCLCDDDPQDLPAEASSPSTCRKVRNAKEPRKDCIKTEKDCSLKGKSKPECSKCHQEMLRK